MKYFTYYSFIQNVHNRIITPLPVFNYLDHLTIKKILSTQSNPPTFNKYYYPPTQRASYKQSQVPYNLTRSISEHAITVYKFATMNIMVTLHFDVPRKHHLKLKDYVTMTTNTNH